MGPRIVISGRGHSIPTEPLAKLRLHAEFFILRGNKSRLRRARRACCFRNESPAESGREHASTRDAIKHLGSRSMVPFSDATGRDRAAHGTTSEERRVGK